MGNFHLIVIAGGTVIIFLSFYFAFAVRGNHTIPANLRNFYLLPLFLLIFSLQTLALNFCTIYPKLYVAAFEKGVVIFEFVFWTYFFINTSLKRVKKTILSIFILFIFLLLLINSQESKAYVALGISNIAKLIFCLLYFYQLFTSPPNLNIKREPVFWIVCGLFFNSAITVPIYLSIGFLFKNNYKSVIGILFPLTNITIIIMHLLFIKGFLCIKQQRIPS